MAISSTGSAFGFHDYLVYENLPQAREQACTEVVQDLMSALQSTALDNQPLQPYHLLNPELLKRLSSSSADLACCDDFQQAGITSISEGDRKGQGFDDHPDKNLDELWPGFTPLWQSLHKLAHSLLMQAGYGVSPSNSLPMADLTMPSAYFAIKSLI